MEHKPRPPPLYPQLRHHRLTQPQRRVVVDLYAAHHRIYPTLLHRTERHSPAFAKLMPCMLQIVQIVGIVDYPLRVHLIVPHLYRHLKHIPLLPLLFPLLPPLFPHLILHHSLSLFLHRKITPYSSMLLINSEDFGGFFAELAHYADAYLATGLALDGAAAEVVERFPHLVVEFEFESRFGFLLGLS